MSGTTMMWTKVPIIGAPGSECGRELLDGGHTRIVASFHEEFGRCDEPGRWLAGRLFLCRTHAAVVAAEFGDSLNEIEAAWRAGTQE